MITHIDPDVNAALIRLSDALCTWERATGIMSVLIVRDQSGFCYRAMDGKPGIPDDLSDAQLLANVYEPPVPDIVPFWMRDDRHSEKKSGGPA